MGMTTQSLSPVTTPGLMYPVLGIPRRKQRKCKHCYGTNIKVTRIKHYENYIAEDLICSACGWYGSEIEEVPQRVELNEKLVEQIFSLEKKTESKDIEYGAIILKKKNKLYLGFEQKGKAHEIDLKAPEKLDEGENIIGTFHVHPSTDTFSTWDIATYLVNDFEKASMVAGSNRILTLAVKTEDTLKLESKKIREWANSHEDISVYGLAEKYRFLCYEGSFNELILKVGKADINTNSLDNLLRGV